MLFGVQLNEYYREKYWKIQTANYMDKIDDEDVIKEIKKDENNKNYQKEDDEILEYLEMIDPASFTQLHGLHITKYNYFGCVHSLHNR